MFVANEISLILYKDMKNGLSDNNKNINEMLHFVTNFNIVIYYIRYLSNTIFFFLVVCGIL